MEHTGTVINLFTGEAARSPVSSNQQHHGGSTDLNEASHERSAEPSCSARSGLSPEGQEAAGQSTWLLSFC